MANTALTAKKKAEFLAALEEHATVLHACKTVGVSRTCVYKYRQQDEDFALAWADAEERVIERMEREALRRGVDGTERDVYHQGIVVGQERQFSDTLLIFMLKSKRPEKYRENVKVEHSGSVGVDLSAMSDDELRAMAAGLDAKRARA